MSAYGTKVVGTTVSLTLHPLLELLLKALRDAVVNRGLTTQNRLNIPTVAPTTPYDGDIYFDKNTLKLKIYVNDGNSSQWVQL